MFKLISISGAKHLTPIPSSDFKSLVSPWELGLVKGASDQSSDTRKNGETRQGQIPEEVDEKVNSTSSLSDWPREVAAR